MASPASGTSTPGAWTSAELTEIDAEDELRIASRRVASTDRTGPR